MRPGKVQKVYRDTFEIKRRLDRGYDESKY